MDFTGKRAVVTGAASGIGRAIAEELVTRGARVLIADINEDVPDHGETGLGACGNRETREGHEQEQPDCFDCDGFPPSICSGYDHDLLIVTDTNIEGDDHTGFRCVRRP